MSNTLTRPGWGVHIDGALDLIDERLYGPLLDHVPCQDTANTSVFFQQGSRCGRTDVSNVHRPMEGGGALSSFQMASDSSQTFSHPTETRFPVESHHVWRQRLSWLLRSRTFILQLVQRCLVFLEPVLPSTALRGTIPRVQPIVLPS